MKLLSVIPWFTSLNVALKLAVMGATVAAILVLVGAAEHYLNAPQRAAQARVEAHAAQVETTTTSQAAKAVLGLQKRSDDKAAVVHRQQEEHAHAIDRLPSAAGAIPDSDADTWRRGLCQYDDTGCAQH